MNTTHLSSSRHFLEQHGSRPLAELIAIRSHGDRLRYVAGCRCDECRKANSAYERQRLEARKNGDWNGIVDAAKARAHLIGLSSAGIGQRAVAAATDIAISIIGEIRTGHKKRIRARTERLILAVNRDMVSESALVPSGPSLKLVNELVKAGFTKLRIATELNGSRSIHLCKQITVRNAAAIKRIHARLINSDEVLVRAAPALRRLATLRQEGFTDKRIARELACPDDVLQIKGNFIPRGMNNQVSQLYERLMA